MTNSSRETYIYDRIGTRIEFFPNQPGNRPSGQRGWLMHHRTGGDGDEGGTDE